ncbi:MAG: S-methyl-5'-thioadenosine phosphorylase [Armatimonadetes bacterium]|nr:S-methyl-5'-thioadenosine phosphorylase [Armatimonadota bacterium]
MTRAEVGVFGGSGFYSLLDDVTPIKVDTPYGPPSDSVMLASVGGKRVAFLPRHGRRHTIPPHMINYRANVWAFHSLGVKAVVSPCACGSLQERIAPGSFLVTDQFVDRTKGRPETFYDGPITTHVSAADIYHPELRRLTIESIRANGITCHETGTVVVIQGPRFSSKAESAWFTKMGWDIINMTQYPEGYLCHELGMGIVNFGLVTDYDSGVVVGTEAVTAHNVLEVFKENAANATKVVLDLIKTMPDDLSVFSTAEGLQFTRGDGHAISEYDVRLFD